MKFKVRWRLVIYDIFVLAVVNLLMLVLCQGGSSLSAAEVGAHMLISFVSIFLLRFCCGVYRQLWRYGGVQCYMLLLFVDSFAFIATFLAEVLLPIQRLSFPRMLSIAAVNLLGTLAMRMMYRYAYKYNNANTRLGKFLVLLLRVFAKLKREEAVTNEPRKVNVAIVGAGRVGVALAEELFSNKASGYAPMCFIDVDKKKISKSVCGLRVLPEGADTLAELEELNIREVILAIPDMDEQMKKALFDYYSSAGYKVKVYDYPMMQTADGKRNLREFDIEELLFRKQIVIHDDRVNAYYKDKIVLITGGGGSIGSELCRQLVKMQPKKIIIADIYENGAYDVQQELRIAYGNCIDIQIEIASITNKKAMAKIFEMHKPQIVINAAAHKHVPLMEHNCVEAVENNVFGTLNLVELCEEYHAERFMMVSTDKAVNPTNVMGATKRMCEMIVRCASTYGTAKYSSTRFGNVLGSAGSVIPLFKKQIASGGPVTLTDKRIIRYFMTIPEASQLVLQSGAMAQNGELFVLDMGKPVRILDLAENMIHLSGVKGIEIIETGLRPGEKLYEELLIKTDDLEKTQNSLIFIERDDPISKTEMDQKLELLREACETLNDDLVRETLKQVVPTYRETSCR